MSERFGLKIGIEGEKEFKKSLTEINNAFKVLGSEMKLVDSEFDKNEKSIQSLSAKNEVLNKEIDAQKNKIETLRQALDNASKSFGENDSRTQKWQVQLNNARAALNDMQRQLANNSQEIEALNNQEDDSADITKQFTDELARQNDQMKVLGSEMKLVASQYDKSDSSVEALTAKNSVLTREIETQREKVETLRKALLNSAESFGENDSWTQSWRVQLNNAEAELNNMERELSANERAIEGLNNQEEETIDATEKLTREISQQESELKELERAYSNAVLEYGKGSNEAKELEGRISQLSGELQENRDALRGASVSTEDLGNKADGAGGKLEKLGSIAKGIGVAFTAAVAAVGAGVAVAAGKLNDCVNVYASFDDSMKQVAATMGMTAEEIANGSEEYAMLEKAAKDAGASTRYTASEAAEALNYLALAGYDAEKSVATMPKVLNLAAAGGMDLATASDMVTDSMSALGMSTEDLDKFMDQMAKTSQKSNTSVQQLGEATLVCAGVVSTTGQDLTTMNTALGVLADNGIKGGEGGTHLRNVLLSLSAPTDVASASIKELWLSIYDAEGNMRDIDDIMADMNASLSTMSGEERTNIINSIFNKTDIAAVNALLGATNGRFDELSGLIEDSAGAAQAMADTMESGLAGTERSFNSAVEGMQIEVGDLFAGFKQTLMSDATSVIRDFTKGLADAGGDWDKIGMVIGQALSDIITLISSYLPQIVDVGITIISTLGNSLMDNLYMLTTTAVDIIMTLIDNIIAALPALTEAALQIIMTLLDGIIDALPSIFEAATQIIVTLATGLGKALPELIPAIVEAVTTIVQTLIDNMPLLIDAALQLIMGLAEGLLAALPVLIEALPNIIKGIVDFILGAIPQIVEAGIQLLTSLVDALPEIIDAIVAVLPTIISELVRYLTTYFPTIVQAGLDLFTSLIQNLPEIINTIVGAIPQIVLSIVDGLVSSIPQIIDAGVQLFVALITNLPTIIVEIVKAVPQIIGGIVDAFGKGMGRIVEIGGNIVKGLWEGIQSFASWLWDSVSGWITGIWDGICDFFGIHSPSREMAWIGEMLVKGLAGSIDDNGGQAVKAAEGMAEDINGVMRGLNDELQAGISSDFKIDTSGVNPSANVNSAASSGGPLFTVGQMIVRSDDDIRKVSQELYNLLQVNSRARGRTVTA